jgi:amidase
LMSDAEVKDMRELHYFSVREQAAALAAREISAVELLEHAIARIERWDSQINAVVVRDFDRARDSARDADAALGAGERRPLLGVPMTVKESFNVAGLPTTWGIPDAKNWVPDEDAVAVRRLKKAGAVIIGKTNVPIFLGDWQSYNAIYGTTNNPWDSTRSPGGSSGGSAASLAAGFSALELGSDIGGSIRVPAHFCGVYGHKPSHGIVPLRGQTPPGVPALPVAIDLGVAGPLARSAADLALALDLIAGPDDAQSVAYALALPAPRHTDIGSFRVLVLEAHPAIPTDRATRASLLALAENLSKAGAKVAYTSDLLPDLMSMARVYTELLTSIFGADMPSDAYRRIQQAASALPEDDENLDSVRLRGTVLTHRDWIRADRIRTGMAVRWRRLFQHFDAVLCPVTPTPAFRHDHSAEQMKRRIAVDGADYPYLEQIQWPGIATVVGLPATAIPVARSSGGLPIGVQIVGPYLEDRTPLALAALIEREFGGFVAPPGFD